MRLRTAPINFAFGTLLLPAGSLSTVVASNGLIGKYDDEYHFTSLVTTS